MLKPSVAVVMPAYNEASGISKFLTDIDRCLFPELSSLTLVVIDDASSEPLPVVLTSLQERLSGRLDIARNDYNMGHGPSALRAYKRGIKHMADIVVHVDGDGQFSSVDMLRLIDRLRDNDVVLGVRHQRDDPWYRRAITWMVRVLAFPLSSGPADVNTPLRAYRREALQKLLLAVPPESIIPHIHFSRLEKEFGFQVAEVVVQHQRRRGANTMSVSWGSAPLVQFLPPYRLLRFCTAAAAELLRNKAPDRGAMNTATTSLSSPDFEKSSAH